VLGVSGACIVGSDSMNVFLVSSVKVSACLPYVFLWASSATKLVNAAFVVYVRVWFFL
jgi:hypothetical protein